MKIYELTTMNRQLLELLEKEEITQEDFEENKQMLVELLEEKSESLIFVNMELETEINRLKEVEKMLAEKRKLLENKQEKFKEFVLNTLDSLNLEEIKTAIGKIKITKSTSTIVEESKLGTDCFDYIQKRKTIKEIESLGYELVKKINRKVSFNKIRLLIEPLKLWRFRNMSREEVEEKLPTELIDFMNFMDSILQKYEFKIGNYKVNNEFGEYTLEVLS